MRYWLPANSVMIMAQYYAQLFLYRTAGLEHPQHAVGDQESADHVAGGGHNGDDAEDGRERALFLADQDNGADHGNRVERIGQRHERRMQQGRDVADDLESDKGRQHEYEKCVDQVGTHEVLLFYFVILAEWELREAEQPRSRRIPTFIRAVPRVGILRLRESPLSRTLAPLRMTTPKLYPPAAVSVGILKKSRTRAFITSPPLVIMVSR